VKKPRVRGLRQKGSAFFRGARAASYHGKVKLKSDRERIYEGLFRLQTYPGDFSSRTIQLSEKRECRGRGEKKKGVLALKQRRFIGTRPRGRWRVHSIDRIASNVRRSDQPERLEARESRNYPGGSRNSQGSVAAGHTIEGGHHRDPEGGPTKVLFKISRGRNLRGKEKSSQVFEKGGTWGQKQRCRCAGSGSGYSTRSFPKKVGNITRGGKRSPIS